MESKQFAYDSSAFSAPISCIRGSKQEGILYIGLNNGNIVRMDLINNVEDTINAGNDRISDIIEYKDSLFIGIRNENVKLFEKKQGKYKENPTRYLISENGHIKEHYWAYALELDEKCQRLILGSNKDTYYLPIHSNETIFRPFERDSISIPLERFYKMLVTPDSIYWASVSALCIGSHDRIRRTLFNNQGIRNIALHDNILTVVTADSIIKVNIETGKIIPGSSEKGKYFASKTDYQNGEWTLSKYFLYYKKDNIKYKYPFYKGLNMRGRHMTLMDSNYFHIACEDQLLSFPLHQNLNGNTKNVVALCKANNKNQYCFITRDGRFHIYHSQLSRSPAQSYTSITKGKIKNLNLEEDIIGMCVENDDYAWLATDRSLYRINIRYRTAHKIKAINREESNYMISILYDDDNSLLYVGTLHNLQYIDVKRQPDSLKELNIIDKTSDRDLFITNIYKSKKKKNQPLYISTLNKGLYVKYNNSDQFKPLLTQAAYKKYGSIYEVIEYEDNLLLRTSKGIFRYAGIDSLKLFNKMDSKSIGSIHGDLHNGYFIVGHQGMFHVLQSDTSKMKKLLFRDMSFNQVSIASGYNKLVLGNQCGLFEYDDNKVSLNPVHIQPVPQYFTLSNTIAAFIGLLLGSFAFIAIINRANNQKQLKYIRNEISELINQIETHINKDDQLEVETIAKNLLAEIEKARHSLWLRTDNVEHLVGNYQVLRTQTAQKSINIHTLEAVKANRKRFQDRLNERKWREISAKVNNWSQYNIKNKAFTSRLDNLKEVTENFDANKGAITCKVNVYYQEMMALEEEMINHILPDSVSAFQFFFAQAFQEQKDCLNSIRHNQQETPEDVSALMKEINEALELNKTLEIDAIQERLIKLEEIKLQVNECNVRYNRNNVTLQTATTFGLDETDLLHIRILAGDEDPDKWTLSNKAKESRQAKIATKLKVPNKPAYIVAKAIREGLI